MADRPYIKSPVVFSPAAYESTFAADAVSRTLRASREVGVTSGLPDPGFLSAPKAGAHQGIDDQRNHELGASQCPLKIPVALLGSVLSSLLPGISDRNLLILLTVLFCHGFRPAWGFCHGFATVEKKGLLHSVRKWFRIR